MNDATLRDEAEERLLTAELAAVMQGDVGHGIGERRTWRRFGAAALVLLGALVTIGVAWLARTPDAMAQDPPFDPVDPWYEHEWPYRSGWVTALVKPVSAAAAPVEVDEFAVTLRAEDSTELAAVLERPSLRRLALSWRNDAVTANIEEALWQRLVARPDLEVLMLAGRFALPPERLRELRRLPRLRYLTICDGAATLDLATAQAVAELPHVRGLMIGGVEIQAGAVAALGGLPHLQFLGVSRPLGDTAGLAAGLPQLRSLRSLVLEQDAQRPFIDAALLRRVALPPRLVGLDLCFAELDDEALAALPARLELLGVGDLDRCTADGIRSLRRLESLRTVRLRKSITGSLQLAMQDVMRDAPLARFDLLVGTLEPALWSVLHEKKNLRRLTVRPQGTSVASVFQGARSCAQLEELTVYVARLPEPDHLAPLRDHPTLRRIVLLADATQAEPFPAEPLAALRASIPVPIDVRPR